MTLFWRNLTIVYLIADIKCTNSENAKTIAIPKCIAVFKKAVNSFHFPIKVSIVSTVQSRQFYIGVNRKCPESFLPIFLPDAATQAQTWGTVVTPYSRRRL